jgi:hypothetical protein
MKNSLRLFLGLFTGLAALAADAPPRYFSAAPGALAETKARLAAGDPSLQPALRRLRSDADAALRMNPPSVMDKLKPGASGDKHDYASQAPYFWPDPSKPDGLPYISKDGLVNPESRTETSDQMRIEALGRMVGSLALAYHFTGNEAYAAHAARCLRVWFLDPATRMNPNFKQGQAVPGLNTGRAIGLIEIGGAVEAIDASALLAGSAAWTDADAAGLKAWAEAFLDWLVNSDLGREEAAMEQNHGTMYDLRVALLALHVGRPELAREICETAKTRRIARQIEPDGRQPLELRRTKSFNYSRLNLRGLVALAEIGRRVGVDLWGFRTADGRSIRAALDFLVPFVRTPAAPWPYEQIENKPVHEVAPLLRAAAVAYAEPDYEAVVAGMPGVETARFQLLRPPPERFTALGNGRDFSDWVRRGGAAIFSWEEDGVIASRAVAGPASTFLCTGRDYGDFILEFEFKVDERLNSGVQIRSECREAERTLMWAGRPIVIPAGRVHGYQVDIDPNVKRGLYRTAGLYDEARRKWLFPAEGDTAAAAAFGAGGREAFDPGQWNKVRVEARGERIRTWLNGHPRADLRDGLTPRGFIGLQVHNISDPSPVGAEVRWRNLRIAEIAAGPEPAGSGTGFVPLFNGRDWTGWTLKVREGGDAAARRVFGITDGMIHVFRDLPDRHELDTGKNDTHGMIYTVKRYKNFIFRFDYKWGRKIANNFAQFQYDAGCYYHVVDDKIWPKGLEYQVRYNHLTNRNHTGDFWSPPDTRIIWSSGDGQTWLAPAGGGTRQPQRKGEHRAAAGAPFHGLDDGWNRCEVIVMGGQYAIHKLNGVVVNYAVDLSPGEGLIGLQAETAEIFYRNVEIREFAEPVPAEKFLP